MRGPCPVWQPWGKLVCPGDDFLLYFLCVLHQL